MSENKINSIITSLTDLTLQFRLFKGIMESEVGNDKTQGNIGRNLGYLSKAIDGIKDDVGSIQEDISNIKTSLAVHDVKIGRSSGFYGAVSGMIVAIVTAVIINYVVISKNTPQPKVIYKEEVEKPINHE